MSRTVPLFKVCLRGQSSPPSLLLCTCLPAPQILQTSLLPRALQGTNANYWMGWMDGDTCYTSNIDYGQNGEVINGVRGTMGGGNYNLQALCKNGRRGANMLASAGVTKGCSTLSAAP